MPHFQSNQGYIISACRKVMTSTLKRQPSLKIVGRREIIPFWLGHKVLRNKQRRHYVVVRNPYARIESFFRDKFRKQPRLVAEGQPFVWQDSIRLFFESLEISRDLDPVTQRDILLQTSFSRFTGLLASLYRDDPHLHPQFWISRLMLLGLPVAQLHTTRLLKLERPDDLEFMREELGIDVSIRVNDTTEHDDAIAWDEESRRIINTIYAVDFSRFNYQVHHE